MKNLLCTLLLALLAFGGSAQIIRVKSGLITIDKQPYARIEPGVTDLFNNSDIYYISSLQNKLLFAVKGMTLHDPTVGPRAYLQFVFIDSKLVVEIPLNHTLGLNNAAREVYAARLLKNGELDPQAVANFDLINGHLYSERRQALNQLPVVLPVAPGAPLAAPKP